MNVLATLLHYANSSPPTIGRREFYQLKSRLLERYATRDGEDVQHIVDECWGYYDEDHCRGESCAKCGGTGIFRETFVLLRRYRWGRYSFHRPVGQPSHTSCFGRWPTIRGRIVHERHGRAAAEATLWLYLLCGEWRLLGRALRSSSCLGWYAWPMLTVQRVVFRASPVCETSPLLVRADVLDAGHGVAALPGMSKAAGGGG